MINKEEKVAATIVGGGCLGFGVIWIISALASLAFVIVVIWAIIKLVSHYT